MCKHEWIQVNGFWTTEKDTNAIKGFYVYCKYCHELLNLVLSGCPTLEYSKEAKKK